MVDQGMTSLANMLRPEEAEMIYAYEVSEAHRVEQPPITDSER